MALTHFWPKDSYYHGILAATGEQLNGFSSVWILKCVFKLDSLDNIFLQLEQVNVFISSSNAILHNLLILIVVCNCRLLNLRATIMAWTWDCCSDIKGGNKTRTTHFLLQILPIPTNKHMPCSFPIEEGNNQGCWPPVANKCLVKHATSWLVIKAMILWD